MLTVCVTDQSGAEHVLTAEEGSILMEVIVGAGLELPAICGGGCNCATCHVFVDTAWRETVGDPNDLEMALIEEAPEYDPAVSRLSCQIELTSALDGLRVALPREFM